MRGAFLLEKLHTFSTTASTPSAFWNIPLDYKPDNYV